MRNALDTLERLQGPGTRERLSSAVPKRLSPLISHERLRNASPFDSMSLADAEDLLFSIDSILGHGAGTCMEEIALHSVSRAISEGAASVSNGDLMGSVLRLQRLLESPFVDVPVSFDVTRHADGFTLTLGVEGRPRATRLLRHYATGAIRAAARFARELSSAEPRLSCESELDRAVIRVSLRSGALESPPPSRPRSKPTSNRSPAGGPGLVAEVERILGKPRDGSERPDAPSTYPPKRISVRPGRAE